MKPGSQRTERVGEADVRGVLDFSPEPISPEPSALLGSRVLDMCVSIWRSRRCAFGMGGLLAEM